MTTPSEPSVFPQTWEDPDHCPFCGAELSNPGSGFVDHLDSSPVCADGFERWRDRIRDDIVAEWGG